MSYHLRHSWQLVRDLAYPWSLYRCRTCGVHVQSPHQAPQYTRAVIWDGVRIARGQPRPDCKPPSA